MKCDTEYNTIALREIQMISKPYDVKFYADIISANDKQTEASFDFNF